VHCQNLLQPSFTGPPFGPRSWQPVSVVVFLPFFLRAGKSITFHTRGGFADPFQGGPPSCSNLNRTRGVFFLAFPGTEESVRSLSSLVLERGVLSPFARTTSRVSGIPKGILSPSGPRVPTWVEGTIPNFPFRVRDYLIIFLPLFPKGDKEGTLDPPLKL